jgi:hypothetical protein
VAKPGLKVKKYFLIIYLLGVVLLCTLRTPVKYYQFYDRYIVIHTHIFSDKGKILMGQFVLYNAIWFAFVFLTYMLFAFIKKNR